MNEFPQNLPIMRTFLEQSTPETKNDLLFAKMENGQNCVTQSIMNQDSQSVELFLETAIQDESMFRRLVGNVDMKTGQMPPILMNALQFAFSRHEESAKTIIGHVDDNLLYELVNSRDPRTMGYGLCCNYC
jgi:hypothetical protein